MATNVVLHRFLAGGIENLFLDGGMHRQFQADLMRDVGLLALGILVFFKQLLDLAVIGLQKGDGIGGGGLFGVGHG